MNILYDHQIFSAQKIGGISRYFVELIRNLPAEFITRQSAILTDNIYLQDMQKSNSLNGFYEKKRMYSLVKNNFKGKHRMYSLVNKLNTIRLLSSSDYDVFHPTYYNPYFLRQNKKPYVLTVHDMIHEKYPTLFLDRTAEFKKKIVQNAAKVIAISNHTKQDLIELYGIDERKIDVVYLGQSIDVNKAEEVKNLPSSYLLYVGGRSSYKNFDTFLKAFAVLAEQYPDLFLICTGGKFTIEEQQKIASLHLSKKVSCLFVSDAQLAYLYLKAKCFVFPSVYEGFGIPILEAFAAGCSIALSNTSCFPEVAQSGGCYFDPYNVDSMVHSISMLLSDESYHKHQIAEGYNVLKQYSWERMGKEIAAIYRSIV